MSAENVRASTRVLNGFRLLLRPHLVDRVISRATQGKAPSSILARIPPGNSLYRRGSIRRVVRGGIAYELDISDFMEWVIYYGITIEPRNKLFSLARQGDTVVDIGTNVGECALNFARVVGPKGRVLAFEPDPIVRAKLERNVSMNSFSNIEIFPVAVGHVNGELNLATPSPGNRGGNTLIEDDETSADQTKVRVVRFDDFFDEQRLSRVDVIKIDVEGYETKALRGAERTLARFKPTLFVEVSDTNLRRAGSSAAELIELLASTGYRLRSAEDDTPVQATDSFEGRHFDVIAKSG